MGYYKIQDTVLADIASAIKEQNPDAPSAITGSEFASYIRGIDNDATLRDLLEGETSVTCNMSSINANYFSNIFRYITSINCPNMLSIPNNAFAFSSSSTPLHIENANFPMATTIGNNAFLASFNAVGSYTLYAPKATYVGVSAFANGGSSVSLTLGSLTYIAQSAFYSFKGTVSELNLNECSYIGASAFCNTNFSNINLVWDNPSKLTTLGNFIFSNATNLPNATSFVNKLLEYGQCNVDGFIFSSTCLIVDYLNASTSVWQEKIRVPYANHISYIDMPDLVTVKCSGINILPALTSVNLPNLTTISDHFLASCTALTTITLPNLTNFTSYTAGGYLGRLFAECTNLSTVVLPKLVGFLPNCFYNCKNLRTIYAPKATYFYSYASNYSNFAGVTSCSMYLGTTPPVRGTSALSNLIPNYSTFHFYVPRGYLSTYQTNTVWSVVTDIQEYDMELTIDGTTYSYDDGGMLWSDWVASDYNTIGAQIVGNGILNSDKSKALYNTYFNRYAVKGDLILGTYEFR